MLVVDHERSNPLQLLSMVETLMEAMMVLNGDDFLLEQDRRGLDDFHGLGQDVLDLVKIGLPHKRSEFVAAVVELRGGNFNESGVTDHGGRFEVGNFSAEVFLDWNYFPVNCDGSSEVAAQTESVFRNRTAVRKRCNGPSTEVHGLFDGKTVGNVRDGPQNTYVQSLHNWHFEWEFVFA